MISLLFVEDNAMIRKTTINLLALEGEFKVIGEAENGFDALALVAGGLRPDIVLADLNMQGINGIELTEKLTVLYPETKVIILTMHAKTAFLKRALAAGARGYLLKNGDVDELFTAIKMVNAGELIIGDDAKG